MIKKLIPILLLPLLLVSCNPQDSADSFERVDIVSTTITPYSGRVRVKNHTSSVVPFDTSIILALYSDPGDLDKFKEDFDFNVKYYHSLFDRYYTYEVDGQDINNIKTINDSYGTGTSVEVDDLLFDTLKLAIEFTKESEGTFNVAIGTLATLWADQINRAKLSSEQEYIDKSYEYGQLYYIDPSDSAINSAKVCVPSHEIIDDVLVLDDANKTVTFNSFNGCNGSGQKAELTFGALGKGVLAQQFANLYEDVTFYINAGQSSVKTNNASKVDSWKLQVANPILNEKGGILGDLTIASRYFKLNPSEVRFDKSGDFNFSTSGYYNNYYVTDVSGGRAIRSHIINPLTGYSNSTFDAVSVFTKDAAYGDMFSTALTNTSSVTEAQQLLSDLNDRFSQDAQAYYVIREEGKEVYYVPQELEGLLEIRTDCTYDVVSTIKVIGQ